MCLCLHHVGFKLSCSLPPCILVLWDLRASLSTQRQFWHFATIRQKYYCTCWARHKPLTEDHQYTGMICNKQIVSDTTDTVFTPGQPPSDVKFRIE